MCFLLFKVLSILMHVFVYYCLVWFCECLLLFRVILYCYVLVINVMYCYASVCYNVGYCKLFKA